MAHAGSSSARTYEEGTAAQCGIFVLERLSELCNVYILKKKRKNILMAEMQPYSKKSITR